MSNSLHLSCVTEIFDPPAPPPAQRRDETALGAVLSTQPVLRINFLDSPQIRLPLTRAGPEEQECPARPTKFYDLTHLRVRGEIANHVRRETGVILFDQEINRLLNVLSGMAWESPIRESDLERTLDENPLIEAIYVFLHQEEGSKHFSSSSTRLLEELQKIGRRKGVDLQSKYWPRSASLLSRRLGELGTQLQEVGIEVRIGRRSGGDRFVNLSLQKPETPTLGDDTEFEPSQVSTERKSCVESLLENSVVCDANLLKKMKKIQATS